jgi:TonB family protein
LSVRTRGCQLSETWKQWEGQVVDGKFPLNHYLGSSEHSAVFSTERGAPPQRAAIKFIQVDDPDAQLQLFRWQHAAKLSHPNLLRAFESGRCHLGEFDLLYVVMEFAEENLSQFLPQRPLTPAEARDVLTPALQGLAFLHGQGLVHGHVRPSNILALDDQLKLSSEGISSIAEHVDQSHLPAADGPQSAFAAGLRQPSPYDPPEIAKGIVSPAGDIWSLGITLVEALTQRLPAAIAPGAEPVVPDTLPALFLDITRHCLHRDPQRRWTVAEIAARLNPGSASSSAGNSVSASAAPPSALSVDPALIALAPSQVPAAASLAPARVESPKPAKPVPPPAITPPAIPPPATKPPVHTQSVAVRPTATRPRYDIVQPHLQRPPLLPFPKFNYLPLGIIVALVLTAIFVAPRLLRHHSPVQTAASAEASAPAPKSVSAPAHTKTSSKSPAVVPVVSVPPRTQSSSVAPSPQKSAPKPPAKSSDAHSLTPANPPATAAALTSVSNPAHVDAKPAGSSGVTQGEVLSQVMPSVSPGARSTIHGTVRVTVKIHVDPAGNVAAAELFSPGPSRYFADQALQAAHKWDFAPAKVDGHAVASNWLVRFEFTPSVTKAQPTQSTP